MKAAASLGGAVSGGGAVFEVGVAEAQRERAVLLYEEAFGQKFAVAITSEADRLRLLRECLNLDYAIGALSDGELVGIAGFHTPDGSLLGGITYGKLLAQLGFVKGNRAALIFALYDRKPQPGELLMDGIAVAATARGKGIGGGLLESLCAYAKQNQYQSIRLDVINTNPDARRLYEKKNFKEIKTEHFPYLGWLLNFTASTTMQRIL